MKNLSAGKKLPQDCWALVEISAQEQAIKYEVNKRSGRLVVDRFLSAPMNFPCNYGTMPQTLACDGDPLDLLIWTPHALHPGCLIRCRPIGVLNMEDEAGRDEKILMLPHIKVFGGYASYQNLHDFPTANLDRIEHFFRHYKSLEPKKWVKISGWAPRQEAEARILEAHQRYLEAEAETAE